MRETCGRSFLDLALEARLDCAATLLRFSGLPVRAVAAASGFRNLAHFHRCFRGRWQVTPLRYRRQEA